MKNFILNVFSKSLKTSPFVWNLLSTIGKNSIRIIYYHMITDKSHDYYFDSYISVKNFTEQIKFLKKKYEVIPLHEAIQRVEQGESLKKCLSITFDDGFSECYFIIAPILYDEKLPATFFLIENTIDNKDIMWRNKIQFIENNLSDSQKYKLAEKLTNNKSLDSKQNSNSLLQISNGWAMNEKDELANMLWEESGLIPLKEWLDQTKPYLTLTQIQELLNSGFHIGSHSKSHPRCDRLDYSELEKEIIGATNTLNEMFNVNINLFSYPFGTRASEKDEQKILQNSNLQCLLGIRDSFSNYNIPANWERENMERKHNIAIVKFLMKPLVRKMS